MGRHRESVILEQPSSSEGRWSCFRQRGREVRRMRSPSPGQSPRTSNASQNRNGPPSSAQSNPNRSPADLTRWSPLRRWWRLLLFPALLLANFVLIQQMTPGQPQRTEVSYTFFKQQVQADNVAQISTRADTIQGTFKQSVAYQ